MLLSINICDIGNYPNEQFRNVKLKKLSNTLTILGALRDNKRERKFDMKSK